MTSDEGFLILERIARKYLCGSDLDKVVAAIHRNRNENRIPPVRYVTKEIYESFGDVASNDKEQIDDLMHWFG